MRSSLDDVQYGILRQEFEEPRIYFALLSASRSCPSLPFWVFTGEGLDDQLEGLAGQSPSRPKVVQMDQQGRVVRLSSIFKWYGKDFRIPGGSGGGGRLG